ncbi:MAG TPA: hypothetical protein VMU22_08275 [Rhizomicrobium sp.]|nr:hypothetical protein [Rhizomicrobium sp.]
MGIAITNRTPFRADATFYLTMAIVSAVLIFVGFAPSFYLKSILHAPPPLSLLTTVHGVVFTIWMGLFVTQAALISANNVALHRQIGMMGALLFGAMISLGYATAIVAGHLGHAPPGSPPPLQFMALPLIVFTGTLVLVALALHYRRSSDWHKRLMLAALFTMTLPGTGRIAIPLGLAPEGTWFAFVCAELLLVIAMAHDWWNDKRVHPAYWVAAGVMAITHIGVAWAYTSPTWLAFAQAIT